MKETTKRYIISSLITFTSVFLLVIGVQLETLDSASLSTSSIMGILTVAVRAGVKAVTEKYLPKL